MSDHTPSTGDQDDRATTADAPIDVSDEPFNLTDSADDTTPAPQRGWGTRTIVLGALLATGLAGAAALGTAAWRITSQLDTTLTAPAEVAGLRRDDGEFATTTAESLRTALTAEVELDDAVGAVYIDPAAKDRSILFFGGTTLLWTPDDDLDTAFELFNDAAGTVTGLAEVPAGSLGGTMKCGTAASADG
ncbi:MAG TPA: hypothetical protein VFO77_14055, partial [Actinoplanes sp.]|nr:hypothetical protein [Actinoplanes sp.]